MLFSFSDTRRTHASILVYKFRPERTGFNMYAKYTRLQLTFLALVPWAGLSRPIVLPSQHALFLQKIYLTAI